MVVDVQFFLADADPPAKDFHGPGISQAVFEVAAKTSEGTKAVVAEPRIEFGVYAIDKKIFVEVADGVEYITSDQAAARHGIEHFRLPSSPQLR